MKKHSNEWQEWTGQYDKRMYDVMLPDGTIIEQCWPNAGEFHATDGIDGKKYNVEGMSIRVSKKQFDKDIPYCPICGGCGYIGCDGVESFLNDHVKGQTTCTNEEMFISEIKDYINIATTSDSQVNYCLEVLNKILKNGSGGGNWRRLINTEIERLQSEES